jgi:hypothetical protein
MNPELLLIQQIKTNAENIEQNIESVRNPELSYSQKRALISYLYAQTRQINELTDGLFRQYRLFERIV